MPATLIEQLLTEGIFVHFWFFADDSNFGFISDEERLQLIEYGMARFSAYPHVLFTLCLEWEETWNEADVVSHMEALQGWNPWDRLASVHGNIGPFDFPNEPWADYLNIQSSQGAVESDTYSAVITNAALASKPVLAEEFWKGAEIALGRRKAWAAFFAGAAGVGTGAYLDGLVHYTENYPFVDLVTDNSRVISGNATARVTAGSDYRFHLPTGGSVTVDLSDASSSLEASFYDPRTQDVIVVGPVMPGTTTPLTFTAPDNQDWILQIR